MATVPRRLEIPGSFVGDALVGVTLKLFGAEATLNAPP